MILEVILGVAALVFLAHLYISRKWNYFSKKGIPYIKPKPFFGSMGDVMFLRKSFLDFDKDIYLQYFKGHKVYGSFEGPTPVVWIQDLDIIRDIMVKDFDHFVNRRYFDITSDQYTKEMIFFARDQHWKEIRTLISPAITSGKMKKMMDHVMDCCNNCVSYLEKSADNCELLNLKEAFGRYTIDTIAPTAFGFKTNSFLSNVSHIIDQADTFINPGPLRSLLVFVHFFSPELAKFFQISVFDQKSMKFFINMAKENLAERDSTEIKVNDFLQFMLDERKGDLEDGDNNMIKNQCENGTKARSKAEMTDTRIIAQALQFFLGGYETTSALLSFVCYELALNPLVQKKLRDEVFEVLGRHTGNITYDSLQEMKYMDMVINESQRLHPIFTRLDRTCTKDYEIPGTDFAIEKGTIITIPVAGIHFDPDYFPNPDKYDPGRFSKEEKTKRNPYLFIPFGNGPRNCVGMRFALLEAKALIAGFMRKVEFKTCEKTPIPMVYQKGSGVVRAEKGIWLQVKRLDQSIM